MRKFKFTLIPICLFIMILSIIGIFSKKEYIKTTGTIIRIEETYDVIEERFVYTPYIDYSVNNVEYEDIEYGAYNSSMEVGDKVVIYYDENDPSFIQAEGYKSTPYITLALSLVFLLISIFIFIKK